MASSGLSVAELYRRLSRAWRRVFRRPAPAPARSSLFHLRLETRHRAAYRRQAERLKQR